MRLVLQSEPQKQRNGKCGMRGLKKKEIIIVRMSK